MSVYLSKSKSHGRLVGAGVFLFALFFAASVQSAPRLSVFHNHISRMAEQRKIPLDEAVRKVRALGVTGVEVMNTEDKASVETVVAAGLEVSRYVVFTDFAKSDSTNEVAEAFAFVARHHVPGIMLVPGYFHTNEMSKAEAWAAMKPRISKFVDAAAKKGISVELEDFDWFEAVLGSRADLRMAFEAEPKLGHVLDTGNYAYWGDDVLAAMREFRPLIRHVHVKDRDRADPRKSVAAGTGTMPIAEIVTSLNRSGYDGWYVIECFGSDDFLRDITRSAEFIRGVFDKIR